MYKWEALKYEHSSSFMMQLTITRERKFFLKKVWNYRVEMEKNYRSLH